MAAPTSYQSEVQTALPQRRLAVVGPLATAAAALANVLFYYFVTLVLQIPILAPEQFPPPEATLLPVTDVVLFSFIFGAGAVTVFWLVARNSMRPARTFLASSAITLLLSMFLPLKIPTPPVPMSSKWSLVMMHMIGAGVVVGMLLALCPAKRQPKS